MTRDDIIRMARDAGLTSVIDAHHKEYGSGAFDLSLYEEVARFFRAAYAAGAAAERVRMCEQFGLSKELAHASAKGNEAD